MDHVFLDTAALIALANKSHALHEQAMIVRKQLSAAGACIVTSQLVLTEVLNAMSSVPLRAQALKTIDALQQSERTTIIPADDDGWRAALDLYRRRSDKDWSLVDCSSILICQSRGIDRIFTHDHHFKQAGFETLLR